MTNCIAYLRNPTRFKCAKSLLILNQLWFLIYKVTAYLFWKIEERFNFPVNISVISIPRNYKNVMYDKNSFYAIYGSYLKFLASTTLNGTEFELCLDLKWLGNNHCIKLWASSRYLKSFMCSIIYFQVCFPVYFAHC